MVILSDGHSSRFDFKVLKFWEKQRSIHLSHRQIQQVSHSYWTKAWIQNCIKSIIRRKELFSPFQTINREGFVSILAEIWNLWAPKEVLINVTQRVGISSEGLDVNKMQQDKFVQAALCIQDAPSPSTPITPKKTRSHTPTRNSETPVTPKSLSRIAKNKFRFGSRYWQ